LLQASVRAKIYLRHKSFKTMTDGNPKNESSPDSTHPNQRWDRWRGRLKLLGRIVLWLLTRGFAEIPDDDYGAKDLDGGGLQTLFGNDTGKKRR
jgi:hypothetical protein